MVSRLNRSVIVYVSYSGNTEEMAHFIRQYVESYGIEVDLYDVTAHIRPIDLSRYDVLFLGTFTWDYGSVPEELEDFLSVVDLTGTEIAFFGSGDTQFGGDSLYCRALKQLKATYGSKWNLLKVEQSPRGYQEERIYHWVKEVVEDVYQIKKSKNIRTALSE